MAGPGSSTRSTEFPVATHSVTQRTHGDVVFWVADFHATERVKDRKRGGRIMGCNVLGGTGKMLINE